MLVREVLGVAGAEQHHVDAGLVAGEAIGGIDDALRAAGMHQEAQRVIGVDSALAELALGDQLARRSSCNRSGLLKILRTANMQSVPMPFCPRPFQQPACARSGASCGRPA